MANSFKLLDQTIHVGDRIAVYLKIVEEGKTRSQAFEGLVIGVRNSDSGKSFVVRKMAANSVGVERIIPVASPTISKIVIKARGNVRRAKLNYLRNRTGRLALRVKEKKTTLQPKKSVKPTTKRK